MKRRSFLNTTASGLAMAGLASCVPRESNEKNPDMKRAEHIEGAALAISMWDFSWIERRWPGAGYENWELALDELVERGYNALRIDAFPHFMANAPEQERTLVPVWNQEDWGSPALNRITIQPALTEFLGLCRERNIMVGLSSWFREDKENIRMQITSPQIMAAWWVETLRSIEAAGLMDVVLFVDLCNEWPGIFWAPYFTNDPPELSWGGWHTEKSMEWMRQSVALFREAYPDLDTTYSFDAHEDLWRKRDLDFLDFLEPHIWMVHQNGREFYNRMEYADTPFGPGAYEILAEQAEALYAEDPGHWKGILTQKIRSVAAASKELQLPLMTSECWAIVNWKDWPLLSWDWVKELCETGVQEAAATGCWKAIATSNFCGPQFTGMWRDIAWHRKMTDIIKGKGNGI